ncbi:n-terminal domain protein [Ichthyophthirius multifiliis]|uniref:N-terminal domain protein n=1 Tax=Ichthyophthirius multifiliis TaxID=5932 RepID=G0QV11_ICHMU|nr:n-terminal domain protein [Ichthyophthirius multifiliis]EGR30936.1 n-terminal domain protein [Ichthyophthirius multifiliis]|eukprot:XP_004032523.1 n-terminal domain protein [Ichthyophthirius multifiliis]
MDSCGRRYFIGSLWMAIMRSQRGRGQAIKFLMNNLPKALEDEEEDILSKSLEEVYQAQDEQNNDITNNNKIDNNNKTNIKTQNNLQNNNYISSNDSPNKQNEDNQQNNQYCPNNLDNQANIKKEFENNSQIQIRENLKFIEEQINDNSWENNYPNKSTLIINTILSCLQDENQLVRRNILDLMCFHLKITQDDILDKNDKQILVEGVLQQFIQKNVSVIRRINMWLFGKPDRDNNYKINEEKNAFVIELIITGFCNIIQNEKQNFSLPLKIILNFFIEHELIIQFTLQKLTIPIIQHIYQYNKTPDVIKTATRFLEHVKDYINLFLKGLSDYLLESIEQKKYEESLLIVNLIYFLYQNLLKPSEGILDQEKAHFCLKETLSGLFEGICIIDQQQQKLMETILRLISYLMERLAQVNNIKEEEIEKNKDLLIKNDASFEKYQSIYYVNFTKNVENINNQKIFKLSSQNLIRGQKFIFEKNKKMIVLPEWFTCISQCIRLNNPSISLIAIESMIEILISEKIDPIYEQLKNLILEEAKQSKNSYKNLLIQNNYTKLTLEKLWSLLDFQHFYDKIIDLIVNFSLYFPHHFKEVVVNSFQTVQITQKESSIRRFATFWRLTANHQHHFVLLQDLNKVGLFIMLDFLDHENPLVRYAAKNWLIEGIPQFYRILDPLFEVLLQGNSSFYITEQKQLFYTQIYETKRTNETLKKLKSILVITSNVFLKYISTIVISGYLNQIKNHFNSQMNNSNNILGFQESLVQKNDKKITYLDLLSFLCLKFIQGQVLESFSLKFQLENAAVNASSCEFLELLIVHIEDPQLSINLCEYLLEPLVKTLSHNVTNCDYVMQVQLLNLFKTIFFNSSYMNKNSKYVIKNKLTNILTSKVFLQSILKGLFTPISYVRGQFINFLNICIPLISSFVHHPVLTTIIKQIMQAYFQLIKDFSRQEVQEQEQQKNKNDQNKYNIENSNFYEISVVLEGVKCILQFFLNMPTLEIIEANRNKHQQNAILDTLKTVFSFGMYQYQDQEKETKITFEKHIDTCNCLIYDIKQVIELLINSWQRSSEFTIEFSIYGIRQYEFERYNILNNNLNELIKQTHQNKYKAKLLIIQIIKPLLFQFTTEVMNSIIILWNRECAFKVPQRLDQLNENEFQSKMIELLSVCNIPLEQILEAINQSFLIEKIINFYKIKNHKEKKNTIVCNYEMSQLENNLLFFIYVNLAYSFVDSNRLKRDNLFNFWNSLIKLLKNLLPSKNPNTVLWIMEILFTASKKYSPKEILSDKKLKKELHDLIQEKFIFVSLWISSSQIQILFNEPVLNSQNNATYSSEQDKKIKQLLLTSLQQYKVLSPFTPIIYDSILNSLKSQENNQLLDDLESTEEIKIYNKYRLFMLESLKTFGLELLQNCYPSERTDRVIGKVKDFMENIFNVMENKGNQNLLYLQSSSQLLYILIEKSPLLIIKEFKKNILEIFNKDNFFLVINKHQDIGAKLLTM